MVSVRNTKFYKEVIKEFDYSYGTIFVFKGFIISEINEGVNFTWKDHARPMADDVSGFLGTYGVDLIYISNRINSYSVVPQDWLKFFKSSYSLKGYYVVSPNRKGTFNLAIESLFFKNKIKNFTSLDEAIKLAKGLTLKEEFGE